MTLEQAPCGACGRTDPAISLFSCEDRVFKVSGESFSVGRCVHCGHVYLSGRPPIQEIGRYYPDGYDAHRKSEKPSGRKKSRRHRFITRKPPFRILDVGCGSGYDLLRFRDDGCEVFGVEFDPQASERARANGIRVFTGGIEQADFPASMFDVITMNFSLEHLYDPRTAMANVRRMLAPDGIAYLLFPTADSLAFSCFKSDWHHLDAPRHLQFFTHASFSILCRDMGLQIVRRGAQSGTRGIRRSLAFRGERSRLARIAASMTGLPLVHWALRVFMRFIIDPIRRGDIAEYVLSRAEKGPPLT